MKTTMKIIKNGDTEDRKAKEQAQTEKANKWTDLSSANCSGDNRSEKRAGWKIARVKSVKMSHSEERKESYIRESSHTK